MRTEKNQAKKPLWLSFEDETESAEGWDELSGWNEANAWDEAAGAPGKGVAKNVSKPFLLRMVNACSTAISDVDLGDSYNNRAASNNNQNANITTSNRISGATYNEFLAQTESQPFKVGKILIISATAAQFNESITITHRDSNGKRLDDVITFELDPYQQQTDRYLIEDELDNVTWDGYTRLRFSAIAASATVDLRIYSAGKFSGTALVSNRPAQIKYSAPRIIKVAPVALPRPGVRRLPGR